MAYKQSTNKKRTYGFYTTKSNMIQVDARNPQEAFRLAKKKKPLQEGDKPFGQYVTFGRYGTSGSLKYLPTKN